MRCRHCDVTRVRYHSHLHHAAAAAAADAKYCVVNQLLAATKLSQNLHAQQVRLVTTAHLAGDDNTRAWLTCQVSGWNDVLYSMMNCRAADDVMVSLLTSLLTCFHSSCTTRALHDTRRTSNGGLGTSIHTHTHTLCTHKPTALSQSQNISPYFIVMLRRIKQTS